MTDAYRSVSIYKIFLYNIVNRKDGLIVKYLVDHNKNCDIINLLQCAISGSVSNKMLLQEKLFSAIIRIIGAGVSLLGY